MKSTWYQVLLICSIVGVGIVPASEPQAWAASCAQHQALQVPVSDVNHQGQAVAVPPSLHQRTQPTSSLHLWEKGLFSMLMIGLALGLALRVRHQQASPLPSPVFERPWHGTSESFPIVAIA